MACFAYVFPCAWEDHCKIGFSRDPLARIQQLHPRWFEVFDLERGLLVEGETQRDARDLELELRRPLAAHRAPPPLTVRVAAGGHTEWFRGAPAAGCSPAQRVVRDVLDAHAALGFQLEPLLPERAWRWYLCQANLAAVV